MAAWPRCTWPRTSSTSAGSRSRCCAQSSTYLAAGQYAELLDIAERSLALDEGYPAALWAKGWGLTTLRDHDAAITAFERAVALSKRAPLLLPALAGAYHAAGKQVPRGPLWRSCVGCRSPGRHT